MLLFSIFFITPKFLSSHSHSIVIFLPSCTVLFQSFLPYTPLISTFFYRNVSLFHTLSHSLSSFHFIVHPYLITPPPSYPSLSFHRFHCSELPLLSAFVFIQMLSHFSLSYYFVALSSRTLPIVSRLFFSFILQLLFPFISQLFF